MEPEAKFHHLHNTIIHYLMRSPSLTPKEILSYLREDRLVARPESGILDFIEETKKVFLNREIKIIPKETPEELPIGASPFMEGEDNERDY